MDTATIYGSSWFAATMAERPQRARLTFDLDVDVCVIGGGLAGLTTAREVARRGWSVAVLEARRVAWNASGRNTGFVLPGFGAEIDQIIARVGLEHAKELWALSQGGVDYVRSAIRDTAMPGVDPVDGYLHVSKTDKGDELIELVQLLGEEFGVEIEGWPVERVRACLKSSRYFHAVHLPRAFHIHPLNYALGLAAAAEEAGVRIFEDTAALEIDPAGVRKRIETRAGRVRAGHIVLAGNVHLGALLPRISATLMPVTTYTITTAPLGDRLDEAITFRGGVSDTDWADNHYRIVGGDRLQWAGRMTTWISNPHRIAKGLRADIARVYPQLGDVDVDYAWSGTLGLSVHRMPQIGELEPGLWLASAFGGHGINTTAMAGELIARAIVEGDQTWRLFLPFELVWAGGVFGRAAAQTLYWGTRTVEAVEQFLARRRDAARRHDEEGAEAAADAPSDPTATDEPRRQRRAGETLPATSGEA
jgi:gamma-glutamylputrescine oxidase